MNLRATVSQKFWCLLLLNVVLRLAMTGWMVFHDRWTGGDTGYYVEVTRAMQRGQWGGDDVRPPFYSHYLWATTGFGTAQPEVAVEKETGAHPTPLSHGRDFVFSVLGQHTFAVLLGVALWWTAGVLPAMLWLFDPGLLIYSNIVMSDALFSCLLLAFGLLLVRTQRESQSGSAKWTVIALSAGVAFGLAVLTRPIGSLLLTYSAAFGLMSLAIEKRAAWRKTLSTVMVVVFLVLLPRLAWMKLKTGSWGLATKGPEWIMEVAGIVENTPLQLDFTQSQKKWFREHPAPKAADAYHTLLRHWPDTLWLSAKGVARVFLGHLNVEWFQFWTGVTPIGPAWFKIKESRAGQRVGESGGNVTLVAWSIGVGVVLIFLLMLYGFAFRDIFLESRINNFNLLNLYFFGAGMALAMTPLVYGDARFRLAVLPWLFLVWSHVRGGKNER